MSFDKISQALDIANETNLELNNAVVEIQASTAEYNELQSDYQLSRETYRALIALGQSSITNLQKVATETDSPFAYEKVAQLMKSISDTTEKLLKLQKIRIELSIEQPPPNEPNKNNGDVIQNNIFFGSTTDLQQALTMIKQKKLNG